MAAFQYCLYPQKIPGSSFYVVMSDWPQIQFYAMGFYAGIKVAEDYLYAYFLCNMVIGLEILMDCCEPETRGKMLGSVSVSCKLLLVVNCF